MPGEEEGWGVGSGRPVFVLSGVVPGKPHQAIFISAFHLNGQRGDRNWAGDETEARFGRIMERQEGVEGIGA